MGTSRTKQTAVSAWRALLLFAIFGVAFIGLMAEPLDTSDRWLTQLLISKAIAVAGFAAFGKLYGRWCRTDKWLKAYNDSCDKALEARNHLYRYRKYRKEEDGK